MLTANHHNSFLAYAIDSYINNSMTVRNWVIIITDLEICSKFSKVLRYI